MFIISKDEAQDIQTAKQSFNQDRKIQIELKTVKEVIVILSSKLIMTKS